VAIKTEQPTRFRGRKNTGGRGGFGGARGHFLLRDTFLFDVHNHLGREQVLNLFVCFAVLGKESRA
jgi:hypothetical protein